MRYRHGCFVFCFALALMTGACGEDAAVVDGSDGTQVGRDTGDVGLDFGNGDDAGSDGTATDGGGDDGQGGDSGGNDTDDDTNIDVADDGGTDADSINDVGGEDATDDTGEVGGEDVGDGGDVGIDIGPDTGPDIGPSGDECLAISDCSDAFGAAPCDGWACDDGYCVCDGCSDADRDLYGAEGLGTCAGLDCDDSDNAIADTHVRSCYSGAAAELTVPVTACRAGTETCIDGAWGQCVGEVTPTAEACNALDDNCEGLADEGLGQFTCGLGVCRIDVDACVDGDVNVCNPPSATTSFDDCGGGDEDCDGSVDEDCDTCVTVTPFGHDDTADGNDNDTPFATIQRAIDWAAADSSRPRTVCVSAGDGCATAIYDDPVTMANGISVVGNYQLSFSNRCTFNWSSSDRSAPTQTIRTVISTGDTTGVLFDGITSPTALDGFEIARPDSSPAVAVTVDSSLGVTLTNLSIPRSPTVSEAIGVDISDGSDVLLTQSSIHGGNGTSLAVGVRAVDSRVELRDNCEDYDGAGRCESFCGQNNLRSIRGRHDSGPRPESYGVQLVNSPGSVVARSAICGNHSTDGATIRIDEDAIGTLIRANLINAWGGEDNSHGVWMEDCGGASPRVVDNVRIAAAGENDGTEADGVRAIGDCHPVIDANVSITGGGEGGTSGANGVHCAANDDGTPSRCTVINNLLIEGSEFGVPPTAVGVRCADSSCVRVAGNVIDAAGGEETVGVWLDNTGAVVEDNLIDGGCGVDESRGVFSEDSWARIENNRITAGYCDTDDDGEYIGLHAIITDNGNELDVHSNVIDAGMEGACTGMGVLVEVDDDDPPSRGVGVFRNNIIFGGACSTRWGFRENSHNADPRIVENNNFHNLNPGGTTLNLYRDEGGTDLTSGPAINGLIDMVSGGNLSENSDFSTYPTDLHLDADDSPCVDAGTATGAPALDMDGQARDDGSPDIGADER